LTPDRSLESLYEELFRNGIVKDYKPLRLRDMVGELSLVNGEIRNFYATVADNKNDDVRPIPGDANPPPSIGDVKKALKDICVLPMGSETVHQISPFTKSLLIAGPAGSGKKTFVRAICSEIRATLFDLTATNIAGMFQF